MAWPAVPASAAFASQASDVWQASLLHRIEAVLIIAAAILVGVIVCFLLYRLWAAVVGRNQQDLRARTRAKPTASARVDPELKVIIDLTDQHLEVMRQRRDGTRLG